MNVTSERSSTYTGGESDGRWVRYCGATVKFLRMSQHEYSVKLR